MTTTTKKEEILNLKTKYDLASILHLYNPKNDNYNIDKAIEELNELATALMQYKLKNGKKTRLQEVIDEIGDVEIRLEVLKLHLSVERNVKLRIKNKERKYLKWIKTKTYKHI